jgi:hypothetical protein
MISWLPYIPTYTTQTVENKIWQLDIHQSECKSFADIKGHVQPGRADGTEENQISSRGRTEENQFFDKDDSKLFKNL